MREADCRKCIWFVPRDAMDDELWSRAVEEWCYEPRKVKGWCRAWNKPVTYYRGTCSRFRDAEKCSLLRWLRR